MTYDVLFADAVRSHLTQLLGWIGFMNSKRRSRFLSHIVLAELEGRGSDLTEYGLGLDVFGKAGSFDPRLDSVVRVYATQIRKKLADYYTGEGKQEPIRIILPAGCYVPIFRSVGNVGSVDPKQTIAITPSNEPMIGVIPILLGRHLPDDALSLRFANELISALASLKGIRVLAGSYTLSLNMRDFVMSDAARPGVNSLIEISARMSSDKTRLVVRLFDVSTVCIEWASTFYCDNKSLDEIGLTVNAIGRAICAEVKRDVSHALTAIPKTSPSLVA